MAVQWLGFCTSTAGGIGSIPGWGAKILRAVLCAQNKATRQKGKELNKSADTLQRELSLPKKEKGSKK